MVLIAWLGGLGSALISCSLTLKLPRCGHREVDNFICEMPALIRMACVYSKVIEAVVFALGVVFLLVPLSLILISYGVITQACHENQVKAARWRKILQGYVFPPHSSISVLWNNHLYVHEATY